MALRDSEISTNVTKREPTDPMYFTAMSLQEEADNEGWTRITKPAGEPLDAMTAGTRGASDESVGDKDTPARGYELPGK